MSKDKGSKNNKKAPAVAKGKVVSDYKSESNSKFAPLDITPLKTGVKPKN